jgi:hypothetical protein
VLSDNPRRSEWGILVVHGWGNNLFSNILLCLTDDEEEEAELPVGLLQGVQQRLRQADRATSMKT